MASQLRKPQAGDITATMKTTMGDIQLLLFPDAAPKAVENFTTHAKNGYYNGLVFHRVIPDFMIQGGDPTGTGMGGESIWGKPFEDEFSPDYHNLRGALSMANAGPGTNGSDDLLAQMETLGESAFPAWAVSAYRTKGGTPWLDFRHTVFGQVYEGMEVVDAIANVPCGRNDKPAEDVVIESVTIKEL